MHLHVLLVFRRDLWLDLVRWQGWPVCMYCIESVKESLFYIFFGVSGALLKAMKKVISIISSIIFMYFYYFSIDFICFNISFLPYIFNNIWYFCTFFFHFDFFHIIINWHTHITPTNYIKHFASVYWFSHQLQKLIRITFFILLANFILIHISDFDRSYLLIV